MRHRVRVFLTVIGYIAAADMARARICQGPLGPYPCPPQTNETPSFQKPQVSPQMPPPVFPQSPTIGASPYYAQPPSYQPSIPGYQPSLSAGISPFGSFCITSVGRLKLNYSAPIGTPCAVTPDDEDDDNNAYTGIIGQ
jgi:hypothetical protein